MKTRWLLANLVAVFALGLVTPARADNCTVTQQGPDALPWRRWEVSLTSVTDYFNVSQGGRAILRETCCCK